MNRTRGERLQAAVRAIPQGQIAEAARKAGIGVEHLRKMRRGESLNPTLDKLGGLANALAGGSIDRLLGESGAAPLAAPRPGRADVDRRLLERLLRDLAALADDARRLAAQLPSDR